MRVVRLVEHLDSNGDLKKVYDADVVIDSIIKLLNIRKGSYIANPELGSNILDYIFDLTDKHTINLLVDEVRNTIEQLPNVVVDRIDTKLTNDRKNVIFTISLILAQGLRRTITLVTEGEYIYMIGSE